MTFLGKQELSEKLAKAYGISDFKYANGWLIKDTARIMELAFEHNVMPQIVSGLVHGTFQYDDREHILIKMNKFNKETSFKESNDVRVVINDHPTKKDAILWAVSLALLKKAEGSKA
jgi:hypothetical protein